jgi:hypothetical protein
LRYLQGKKSETLSTSKNFEVRVRYNKVRVKYGGIRVKYGEARVKYREVRTPEVLLFPPWRFSMFLID